MKSYSNKLLIWYFDLFV